MVHLKLLTTTILICLFISSQTLAENHDQSRVITLDEAVNISISNNTQIEKSKADIDISKADLKGTKSILYPQIETRFVLPFIEAESGFFLDQLIWDFGRTQNDIRARRFDVDSQKSNFESTKSNVVRDTKVAYFEALIAKNNMEIQEKAIESRELIVDRTREYVNAGIKGETDLSRSELDLQQSILDYNDMKNHYRVSKLNLSRIMGTKITSDFEIEDSLEYDTNYLDKEELVELAVSSNHQIKSIVSRQAGLRAQLKSSKSNFFPRIFGRVAYRFDGRGSDEPDFIAGIGIRVPIFKGFARFAEIDRSDAQLRRNLAELNEVKKNVIYSVEELYLQMQNLEEKIDITEKSRQIAERNFKLARQRYQLERASRIELAEAIATHTASLAEYENAIYNYQIAKIRIRSLIGE